MRSLILLITVSLLLFNTGVNAQNPPKREFRGAWFPTVVNRTWRNMTTQEIKKDIIFYLDLFKELNMNAVIFQVRPQADAMFVSDIEPWSRFITGEQGRAPEPFFDPTQFIIEESHKRGMELHAWFNPYRVTSNRNEVLSANHIYFKKPHLFVSYGNQIYFDPGQPGSREHTIEVIRDFVTRYDADAVHFDDYFYPYRVPYQEFPDDETFKKYHHKDGFDKFDKDNWRRNNVNILVRELNEVIKSVKPWVKFGISPFGVWRNDAVDPRGSASKALQTNYDDLFADILLWTKEGWIDYNAPQLYWEIGHARADYAPLIEWWSKNNHGVNLYIGQSIWNQTDIRNRNGDIVNQLYRKMGMVRENPDIHGNIWWSGLGFPGQKKLSDSLKNSYQRYPALIPLYRNIDTIAPAPVKNLVYSRKTLKWDTPDENDPMNVPQFYVIYKFDINTEVNLDDPSAIFDIVNTTSYTTGRMKGVKIAVTALDRLKNESKPQVITVR